MTSPLFKDDQRSFLFYVKTKYQKAAWTALYIELFIQHPNRRSRMGTSSRVRRIFAYPGRICGNGIPYRKPSG